MIYNNPILLGAAVIPAIFLVVQIYRADKLEREPVGMIISLVFWGAVSTLLAGVGEEVGMLLLDRIFPEESVFYNLVFYFLVVGLAEEGFKYLMLYRRTWESPQFNCQFDGVVYGACIALGFALWENISYVGRYGLGTALIRAVTAVPGHGCFGVFMGAFYGMARRYENFGYIKKSRSCRRLAVIVPLLLHGTYDFIVSLEQESMQLVFLAFAGGMFAVTSLMVRRLSKSDRFIRARTDYFQ